MHPSESDFIRLQGFTTEGCQEGLYAALMFQPRVIAFMVITGAVLQSPLLFAALSAVLWWGAVAPRLNLFDAVYNRTIARERRVAAVPAAPAPRRFSQAVAGSFSLTISIALFAQANPIAWLLEGIFVAASMSVVVRRFCLPAYVYHLLRPASPVTPCPSPSGRA